MNIRKRASERIEFINPGGDENRILFDLSKGGACCLSHERREKGASVTVDFDGLEVAAKITYCIERTDGFRVGMQFWHVDANTQKQIDSLVERFSRGVPIGCRLESSTSGDSESEKTDSGEESAG